MVAGCLNLVHCLLLRWELQRARLGKVWVQKGHLNKFSLFAIVILYCEQIKFAAHRNIGLYILLPFMMRPSPVPSSMACILSVRISRKTIAKKIQATCILSGGMFASFGTSTFVLPLPSATCITWKSFEDNDRSMIKW